MEFLPLHFGSEKDVISNSSIGCGDIFFSFLVFFYVIVMSLHSRMVFAQGQSLVLLLSCCLSFLFNWVISRSLSSFSLITMTTLRKAGITFLCSSLPTSVAVTTPGNRTIQITFHVVVDRNAGIPRESQQPRHAPGILRFFLFLCDARNFWSTSDLRESELLWRWVSASLALNWFLVWSDCFYSRPTDMSDFCETVFRFSLTAWRIAYFLISATSDFGICITELPIFLYVYKGKYVCLGLCI